MDPLYADVAYIRRKVDKLDDDVSKLDKDLAVHKAKTARWSLFMGGIASLLVAVGAALLKGCS